MVPVGSALASPKMVLRSASSRSRSDASPSPSSASSTPTRTAWRARVGQSAPARSAMATSGAQVGRPILHRHLRVGVGELVQVVADPGGQPVPEVLQGRSVAGGAERLDLLVERRRRIRTTMARSMIVGQLADGGEHRYGEGSGTPRRLGGADPDHAQDGPVALVAGVQQPAGGPRSARPGACYRMVSASSTSRVAGRR